MVWLNLGRDVDRAFDSGLDAPSWVVETDFNLY
jgi:hypothetical protein